MAEYATSIDIQATPEVVFAHLVTAEGMLAWMGEHADLQPIPGGRFAVDINGSPIRGRYLEVDPPHRVVVSWGVAGSDDHPPGSSRVEFTLTTLGEGTRLDVVHTGLPATRVSRHAEGWAHFLARLQQAAGGTDLRAIAAQDLYEELAAEHLRNPAVSLGRALQNEVLKVNGKIFAFIKGDRLVVKLPAPQATELVASGQAVAFTSGGRTMREWVAVEPPTAPADGDRWRRLMTEAADYVATP